MRLKQVFAYMNTKYGEHSNSMVIKPYMEKVMEVCSEIQTHATLY